MRNVWAFALFLLGLELTKLFFDEAFILFHLSYSKQPTKFKFIYGMKYQERRNRKVGWTDISAQVRSTKNHPFGYPAAIRTIIFCVNVY